MSIICKIGTFHLRSHPLKAAGLGKLPDKGLCGQEGTTIQQLLGDEETKIMRGFLSGHPNCDPGNAIMLTCAVAAIQSIPCRTSANHAETRHGISTTRCFEPSNFCTQL